MKACQGRIGRAFVLRLEDGDEVPACIEKFAAENQVFVASVVMLGSVAGGQVVVGARDSDAMPPDPMLLPVDGAHEVAAVGVIAPVEGRPVLHIHGALGRSGQTMTGCLRPGVKVRMVGEVIVQEILGTGAARPWDEESQHNLLEPGEPTG